MSSNSASCQQGSSQIGGTISLLKQYSQKTYDRNQ